MKYKVTSYSIFEEVAIRRSPKFSLPKGFAHAFSFPTAIFWDSMEARPAREISYIDGGAPAMRKLRAISSKCRLRLFRRTYIRTYVVG